ncbi:metal ABC transporter permease [Pedosphaera parvula]|uniref:ABC-3 protein n=1 Tax=Pedosphaera parvula (strain Ellin514) TaxID=320771 RepID=B9XR74_PEDPL|nr:metal ABC transporter permease [Pedosphaera parvula]EEF57687.1 ABC-3 protein [Pedosphaera parvula Ellin514]
MFTEPFMQRALLAALCLGPLCALLGVFVIARRMAFFSDTVSHSALAGVALGFWLGFAEPTVPMVGFSLLVAAAMMWLKERTELLSDTIMALLLSGSVALGVIILSLLHGRNYQGELERYLFGDILAIEWKDVWLGAVLLGVVGTGIFVQLSSLTLLSAQEDMAYVCGVRVKRLNYLFVLVLTLTVAMSIRLLGIILVTSLIVIPPASARSLSRNLRQQILFSLLFGLLGGVGGTILSYQLDVPCGSTIVLTCVGIFVVAMIAGKLRTGKAFKSLAT